MGNSSLSPGLWVQVAPVGAERRLLSSPRHCSARGPAREPRGPGGWSRPGSPGCARGALRLVRPCQGSENGNIQKHSSLILLYIVSNAQSEGGAGPCCNWKLTGSPTTSHLSPERLQSVLQALASVNPHSIPGRGPGVLRTKVPRHREVRPPGRSHTANSGSGGQRAAALPATSTARLCDSHPRTRDEPPPRQALETSR